LRIAMGISAPSAESGFLKSSRRTALWTTAAVVGIFLFLCANERLGDPPLMTPALHPSADLLGRWQGKLEDPAGSDVEFLIAADAGVSGHVGDKTITGGWIANNRSWFDSITSWREPYKIRAREFTAEVNSGEGELGAFILPEGSNRAWRVTLRKQ